MLVSGPWDRGTCRVYRRLRAALKKNRHLGIVLGFRERGAAVWGAGNCTMAPWIVS